MITLIELERKIIKKELAQSYNFEFIELDNERFYLGFNGCIEKLGNGCFFVGELDEKKDVDGRSKYYHQGDEVESYMVVHKTEYKSKEKLVELIDNRQLVDLNSFAFNYPHSYKIIKAVPEQIISESTRLENEKKQIRLIEKMELMSKRLLEIDNNTNTKNYYNERCDVSIGSLLVTFNETKLLDDSCTDLLQSALDEGWRIIAACPQPDSRRPDYILGRYNPER